MIDDYSPDGRRHRRPHRPFRRKSYTKSVSRSRVADRKTRNGANERSAAIGFRRVVGGTRWSARGEPNVVRFASSPSVDYHTLPLTHAGVPLRRRGCNPLRHGPKLLVPVPVPVLLYEAVARPAFGVYRHAVCA